MNKKYLRRRTDIRSSLKKRVAAMFANIPTAILVTSFVLFVFRHEFLTSQTLSSLSVVSYSLAIVGMAINIGFNRSRAFFILLLLIVSQLAFYLPAPASWDDKAYHELIFNFSTILLPFNILVFSLLKEQGPFTTQGKRRWVFVLAQLVLVAVIIIAHDQEMLGYVQRELVSPALTFKTALPTKAIVLMAAGLLLLFFRQITKNSVVDNAFFICLLTLAAAFHFGQASLALPLFLTAATIILTVAAIQESYFIAYLDELTGLPARRSLQEEMDKLGDCYAVAMVDIDYFKKVNDKYGHDVGDDALRFIATFISKEVAAEGKVFRYGGEEFTIIFPGKNLTEVVLFLERLCQLVSRQPFFLRGREGEKKLTITVSIGVAERNIKLQTTDQVIKAADRALYRAKEQGRNRVASSAQISGKLESQGGPQRG